MQKYRNNEMLRALQKTESPAMQFTSQTSSELFPSQAPPSFTDDFDYSLLRQPEMQPQFPLQEFSFPTVPNSSSQAYFTQNRSEESLTKLVSPEMLSSQTVVPGIETHGDYMTMQNGLDELDMHGMDGEYEQ